MSLPAEIRIVEVGPRDGLQNERWCLPARQRVDLIDILSRSGVPAIEVGSFVSPRRVPQMANSDAVLAGIRRAPGVAYSVLVPNAKGMEAALAAGADEVAVFLSATESFSRRNINCSIRDSLERAVEVVALARTGAVRVRGYVSCVLGCPYEGEVPFAAVAHVAERLAAMGCYEISLGDTIGVGTPDRARAMVQAVAAAVPVSRLAVHFHDTFGRGLANVLACLEDGIAVIDASVGGLGGCPYAPGSSGNLATEELVAALDGLGVHSGVDLDTLEYAIKYVESELGIARRSKRVRALGA